MSFNKDNRRKDKFDASRKYFDKKNIKNDARKFNHHDEKISDFATFINEKEIIFGLDIKDHMHRIRTNQQPITYSYDQRKDTYSATKKINNEPREIKQTITFEQMTTIECAYTYSLKYPDKKICILNFASARQPGGGFLRGKAKAQEESICYVSTLYHTIVDNDMYTINNNDHRKGLYHHIGIYSPEVFVFKQDRDDPKILDKPFYVSVITCPAVNKTFALSNNLDDELIDDTMFTRIDLVLHIASVHQPDILILGAFGCGVFGNEVSTVSSMFNELLYDKYTNICEKVIFAIPDNKTFDDFYQSFNDE